VLAGLKYAMLYWRFRLFLDFQGVEGMRKMTLSLQIAIIAIFAASDPERFFTPKRFEDMGKR
jgi:hypothetical protein